MLPGMCLDLCDTTKLTCFPGKQVYRLDDTTTTDADGFSNQGGIYVLANILHNNVHSNIIEGRNQLCLRVAEHFRNTTLDPVARAPVQDFSTPANAFFISAVFGLGSFLDSMAVLCNRMYPDGEHADRVNFMQYGFKTGETSGLHLKKLQILSCTFAGKEINGIWNQCKHERPWLGLVTISEGDGDADIRDNDGKRFFRDFIMPIYKDAQDMLSELARRNKVTLRKLSL